MHAWHDHARAPLGSDPWQYTHRGPLLVGRSAGFASWPPTIEGSIMCPRSAGPKEQGQASGGHSLGSELAGAESSDSLEEEGARTLGSAVQALSAKSAESAAVLSPALASALPLGALICAPGVR